MKKTPWFHPSAKPVRKGWYDYALFGIEAIDHRLFWNGQRWLRPWPFSKKLVDYTGPSPHWRGITREPT